MICEVIHPVEDCSLYRTVAFHSAHALIKITLKAFCNKAHGWTLGGLPWVKDVNINNPGSGCVILAYHDYTTTFRVESCVNKLSQGSLWQPWALLRNAVGILRVRN